MSKEISSNHNLNSRVTMMLATVVTKKTGENHSSLQTFHNISDLPNEEAVIEAKVQGCGRVFKAKKRRELKLVVDSGAQISLISRKSAIDLGFNYLSAIGHLTRTQAVGGRNLMGFNVFIELIFDEKILQIPAFVPMFDFQINENLLGMKGILDSNIIILSNDFIGFCSHAKE